MKNIKTRILGLSLVCMIMSLCFFERAYSDDNVKHARGVLYINSYSQGLEWADDVTSSIRNFFDNEHPDVNLIIENMDSKVYSLDKLYPALYNLYKIKYTNNQPRVIICSDNNALDFLISSRDSLFPGVPIVFCGINNFNESILKGQKNITGVVEDVSFLETAELAMTINPNAKRIYLLAGSSKTATANVEGFYKKTKGKLSNIEVIPLHNLTLDELSKELPKIDKDDIIINFGVHYTRDEHRLTPLELYEFTRKYTLAPIFNSWTVYKEFSTGGVMLDAAAQGRVAAEMALEILNGTPADQIKIVTESPNISILNFRELELLGIPEEIAPEGTTIINRPFSIYKEYKLVVWSVSVVLAGMMTMIFFLYINIVKRRKVELDLQQKNEWLKEQEENLRVTLSSIGEGVIVTNTDGNILQINPVAEKLTGWSAKEAVGKLLIDVFKIVDSGTYNLLDNPVEEVINSGETVSQNCTALLISRDKSEYHISDSAAPILNNLGEIIGVVLVFRDITEENALQVKLHQSQKMDAVGQLSAGIAHDFNNMLGGILSAADLVRSSIDKGRDPVRFLDLVVESAERAAALTSKLLAFSRQHSLSYVPVCINDILSDTLSLFSNTIDKRIKIDTQFISEDLLVNGDFSLLQNAFMNLFINAAHAMPEGGNLNVSLQMISLDLNYCKSSVFELNPGSYAEIEIRDTGCGISQDNTSKIFEPFFTTKKVGQGTGLGLSAVFGTVQQHNGSISVYSEEGTGTSFHIMLPLSDGVEQVDNLMPVENLVGTGTILVVDDEMVMRETAKAVLENIGYTVLLAEDGREGKELFIKEMDRIDLVIIDMIMPEMNGRDCFFEIKKIKPDAKIVVSSGFSRSEELDQLNEAGLLGFIHKPFRAADLCRLVINILNS